jgi:hypothetical protein
MINCGCRPDCKNLFRLEKYELGKIDLWMKKTLQEEQRTEVETGVTIGPAEARKIAKELLWWADNMEKEQATGRSYWDDVSEEANNG